MKKNNNYGFILLETLIVSTFVIGVLVFLYVQFANIKRGYDESFKINSIPGLYGAFDLKKHLVNVGYENLKITLNDSQTGYIELTCSTINGNTEYCTKLINNLNINKIIFTNANLEKLRSYLNNNENIKTFTSTYSNDFYKYISKISVNNTETNYRLLIRYNDNTYTSIILE